MGRSQQRVSGNAKPASSGRIRELLVNQQQSIGKVITFSALAQKASSNPASKEDNESQATPDSLDCQPIEQKFDAGREKASSPGEKMKLVVKRVGNRDYFTRVKVTDNAPINEIISDQVRPCSQDQTKVTSSDVNSESKEIRELEEECDDGAIEAKSESSSPKSPVAQITCTEPTIQDADSSQDSDFETMLEEFNQMRIAESELRYKNLSELNADQINREVEMLKLFGNIIRNYAPELSIEEWDFIFSSLYDWVKVIIKSSKLSGGSASSRFCSEVFYFIDQLITLAANLKKNPPQDDEFPMQSRLIQDWENFQASKTYRDIIELFFRLACDDESSSRNQLVLEALANIVIQVDPHSVITCANIANRLNVPLDFEPETKLPDNSKHCDVDEKRFRSFLSICSLLKSNQRTVIVTSHSILRRTIDLIYNEFKSSSSMLNQEETDDVSIFPPSPLMSILISQDSIMTALLSDFKAGDTSVTIEPQSDSYACTLSYLFVWDLIIEFLVGVDKEIGQQLIHSFKKLGVIQRLLDNIFMLLPPLGEKDSLNFRIESDDEDLVTNKALTSQSISNFLKQPLRTNVKRPVNEIELSALHLYFSVALHFPVSVRKWYNNNSNKRLCNLVNEYTGKHISHIICSLEMETVQEKCQERANEDKLKNLVIKARPNLKEVYACYTRDEFIMELTIRLPPNYPLNPVQIDGGKRVGVTDMKWRSWLLQLTTFLAHQNGPILDGIDLWRRNIDKRFEGVEKCMICFSILHSNYQLPRLKCRTCSHMFHNLCLRKWFETSGRATCPLCRSVW